MEDAFSISQNSPRIVLPLLKKVRKTIVVKSIERCVSKTTKQRWVFTSSYIWKSTSHNFVATLDMRRARQKSEGTVERQKETSNLKSRVMFDIWRLTSPKVGLILGVCLCVFSTVVIFILSSNFKESYPGKSIVRAGEYSFEAEEKGEEEVPPKDVVGQSIDDSINNGNVGHKSALKHERFSDKSLTEKNPKNVEGVSKVPPAEIELENKRGGDINKASISVSISGSENADSTEYSKNFYVLLQLVNAYKESRFANNFYNCIKSILKRTQAELKFLLTVDEISKTIAEESFRSVANELKIKKLPSRTYFMIGEVNNKVYPYTKALQELFSSGQGAYYSNALFFIGPVLHKFLPSTIKKLVMLDTDLQFRTDIKELFALFGKMSPKQVMALATDQQPVYRHVLWSYRQKNPGTKVGGPPPDGKTGFNSGVKLVNLEEMRNSRLYNDLLHGKNASHLARKYEFKGHLGDQDFYSLASFDYPDLFYTLPCQWNRQLCTWWKNHGYNDIFDMYFKCSPPFYVIHGNCNTPIPDEQ